MLTERQEHILGLIVGDYIKYASPIGSESIARNHDLKVSSATIRNDVAQLEDEGYTTRPHLSAGSVPLDKGYRQYVESVVDTDVSHINPTVQSSVRKRMIDAERDMDTWTGVAATILSQLAGNMAIVTFPKARESRIKHMELVYLQEYLFMLIVVLEEARLRRHLIRFKKPVHPADLEASANKVKHHLVGLTRHEIGELEPVALTPLEEELLEATVLILNEEDQADYRDHYVDGLRNLLSQPEFSDGESMRAMVEGVEDGSIIQAILEETAEGGVVRVVIGHEHQGDVLWPLSVVVCQYGIPGEAVGVMGAVGPTRMEYSKTIASVKLLSSTMSELVQSVHSG